MNLNFKKVLSLIITLNLLIIPTSASCFAGPREFKKIAEPALSKCEALFTEEPFIPALTSCFAGVSGSKESVVSNYKVSAGSCPEDIDILKEGEVPYREHEKVRFRDDEEKDLFIYIYNMMIGTFRLNQPMKTNNDEIYIYDLKAAHWYWMISDLTVGEGLFLQKLMDRNIIGPMCKYDPDIMPELEIYGQMLQFPDAGSKARFAEIYREYSDCYDSDVLHMDFELRELYYDVKKHIHLRGVTLPAYSFLAALAQFNGMDMSVNDKLLSSSRNDFRILSN